MTREDPADYAQRRANVTGTPYAVFRYPESVGRPDLVYAAYLCPHNRKMYADLGATVVTVYRRAKGGPSC